MSVSLICLRGSETEDVGGGWSWVGGVEIGIHARQRVGQELRRMLHGGMMPVAPA